MTPPTGPVPCDACGFTAGLSPWPSGTITAIRHGALLEAAKTVERFKILDHSDEKTDGHNTAIQQISNAIMALDVISKGVRLWMRTNSGKPLDTGKQAP